MVLSKKKYVGLRSKVNETYKHYNMEKKYNYVSDLYLSIWIMNRSVLNLLFTLLWYIPDYFLYHLQSRVTFAQQSVPNYYGVV